MAKDAAVSASKAPKADKSAKVGFSKRVSRYFKDLSGEIKKVVWPDKKQIKNNTLVVIAFCVVAAIFVCGFDFICSVLVKLLVEHKIPFIG